MLRSESLEEEAAKIAVAVMREYEKKFDEIVACCFSAVDKMLYERILLDESTQEISSASNASQVNNAI